MQIMIWIDSSFAVEWLLGTEKAKQVGPPKEPLGILPMQYTECLVFFLRHGYEALEAINHMAGLELFHPETIHLHNASFLYLSARINKRSKASLADAILAAVAREKQAAILSFDHDFIDLGFEEKTEGLWLP